MNNAILITTLIIGTKEEKEEEKEYGRGVGCYGGGGGDAR